MGKALGKRLYRPGLNLEPPPGTGEIDCVMTRFAQAGVPVIHLVEVQQLARQYGLPDQLSAAAVVGQGGLFGQPRHSRLLAAVVLVVILLALRSIVLADGSYRLVQKMRQWVGWRDAAPASRDAADPRCGEPEWMV